MREEANYLYVHMIAISGMHTTRLKTGGMATIIYFFFNTHYVQSF